MVVTELRIFPIKGLDGSPVQQARVLANGALEFDRRWAMVDARGRFVNGKNRPEVHAIRAAYDIAGLTVSLDGREFSLTRDGRAIAEWFSERLGDPVEWRENADAGFPDDTDSPGPTLVSSASVARVGEWFLLSVDEVRRRFRANLEFEAADAFWEDRLYGSRLRVGSVEVDAVNPCQRCPVPSRNSLTGAQDPGFQKRFAELRQAELPATAVTGPFTHYYRFSVNTRIPQSEAGKTIRVGDAVTFE
jgi:uncharacterized protein YcbX